MIFLKAKSIKLHDVKQVISKSSMKDLDYF